MRRVFGRSSTFWLALLIWAIGAIAAKADVTYNYTGNVLTPTFGDFPAEQSITGDIITSSPLPNSAMDATPNIVSFSFSDGVDTISSSNGGSVDVGATSFQTNSLGEITSGGILVFESNASPPLGGTAFATIHVTPFGDGVESIQSTGPGSVAIGEASNSTPGIWTSPPPSLYLTVDTLGRTSLSGDPIDITASLALATTQPPDSVLVPLPKTLSSNDATLQDAAHDLGYIGFDWEQVLRRSFPLFRTIK
jgi:hypothetical protein